MSEDVLDRDCVLESLKSQKYTRTITEMFVRFTCHDSLLCTLNCFLKFFMPVAGDAEFSEKEKCLQLKLFHYTCWDTLKACCLDLLFIDVKR